MVCWFGNIQNRALDFTSIRNSSTLADMRVLGRTRLSRSTEESTSIERQHEIIENWADTHGHEIVGWAEDVDVSGSVDPFNTPGLGHWLKPEHMDSWFLTTCTND